MVKISKKGEQNKGSSSFVLSSCKFNTKCTAVGKHRKLLNPNHKICFLTVRQISEWQPLLHFENKGPECNLAQSVAYVATCWNPEKKHNCFISQQFDKIKKANPKPTFITHLPAKLTMAFYSSNGYYNGWKCILIYFQQNAPVSSYLHVMVNYLVKYFKMQQD